jgi:hypothetical protein
MRFSLQSRSQSHFQSHLQHCSLSSLSALMLRVVAACALMIISLALQTAPALAQTGLTIEEMQEKLKPYFADELIDDVREQLPKGVQYRIWGWDVGDYSGDKAPDLVLSVRQANDKGKNVNVYLFTDIDGYLTRVGKFTYTFLEVPIEVGVFIKDNGCFVLQKAQDFEWSITGYRFDNGSLIVLDAFKTERVKNMTHEAYHNYQTLTAYERYRDTKSNDELFYADYLSVPSYPRGSYVFKGFSADAVSNQSKYITKGAFYWSGEADASFSARSVYNEQYLYFLIKITDDKVVSEAASAKEGTFDNVEIWLDMSNVQNRFVRKKGKADNLTFRTQAESGIFAFTITPGNFAERKPSVRTSASDELTDAQKQASSQVKAVASLWEKGYVVKLRVPFQLLGFTGVPIEEGKVTEYGCTVLVNDIDNEFRPEERTIIATSKFSNANPSSYGSVMFIPNGVVYGEARNIYSEPVVDRLKEIGF